MTETGVERMRATMRIMKTEFVRLMVTLSLLAGLLCAPCKALRPGPDRAKVEAETKQIQQMVAANDITGLIDMLSSGEFPSKVAAAEHLGKLGDRQALPALKQLNKEHGGWKLGMIDDDRSGAFAVAICKILIRDLPEKEQIEAMFELLEGKGPAVPEGIGTVTMTVNGVPREMPRRLHDNLWVGKRVAAELDNFDDPSIIGRLRQSTNREVAVAAVWMEVRDMAPEDAIARCMQIARDEGRAQRYGAISSIGKLGPGSVESLHELAGEGHPDAIEVLGRQKENEKVFDLLCWHLTNNMNSLVRLRAVSPVAFVESDLFRLKSLRTLVQALYDPRDIIRRSAAFHLSTRAYKTNKAYFNQIEDSLLVALNHPDAEVRERILKSLKRLGCERLGEAVADPPPFRTDLEERGWLPPTAAQRLRGKTEPLEKEAAKALKMGPPEKAVTLYKQLLQLKPAHEPYEQALEKSKAYIKAAAETAINWYPDAPYIGLKGRYSYLLASGPQDTSTLRDEHELAQDLCGTHFRGWTDGSMENRGRRDQFEKAIRLYEHIVQHYPGNEYLVIASKAQLGGFRLNLDKDVGGCILAYIDVFAMPVEDVVDSTRERRDIPLDDKGGKTRAQLDFERYLKDLLRDRVIELCTRSTRGTERSDLLDEIIRRCSKTDSKIVEMARAAKTQIDQK
jgi:HEAT repeat protein